MRCGFVHVVQRRFHSCLRSDPACTGMQLTQDPRRPANVPTLMMQSADVVGDAMSG